MMHRSGGLVIPSAGLYLTASKEFPRHVQYAQGRDSVATACSRLGYRPLEDVRGNLPLSYGFASSTILAMLHLRSCASEEIRNALVNYIDSKVHGFPPSGLDIASICAQEQGIFHARRGWEKANIYLPKWQILLLPKENAKSLKDTQSLMLNLEDKLCNYSLGLILEARTSGAIEADLLYAYCRFLASSGIYSRMQFQICDLLLKQGVAVKAIGGIYDKALIVFCEDQSILDWCIGKLRLSGLGVSICPQP